MQLCVAGRGCSLGFRGRYVARGWGVSELVVGVDWSESMSGREHTLVN